VREIKGEKTITTRKRVSENGRGRDAKSNKVMPAMRMGCRHANTGKQTNITVSDDLQ
jgi:hypothetical protein